MRRKRTIALSLSLFFILGCGYSGAHAQAKSSTLSIGTDRRSFPIKRDYRIGALIYHGAATAFGDVESISEILDAQGITHQDVTSEELNQMTVEELTQFGMIVWPGGYAGQMSASLYPATRDRVRRAVRERGVNFVGICAGAFIAVSPAAPSSAEGPEWGLSIIDAETLPYYHLEGEGLEYSLVDLEISSGIRIGVVWWGGPTLPEVSHGVLARYLDNHEPAVIQTQAGFGWVFLAGPHPEAPHSLRVKLGLRSSDGLDHEFAGQIFRAALGQEIMTPVE